MINYLFIPHEVQRRRFGVIKITLHQHKNIFFFNEFSFYVLQHNEIYNTNAVNLLQIFNFCMTSLRKYYQWSNIIVIFGLQERNVPLLLFWNKTQHTFCLFLVYRTALLITIIKAVSTYQLSNTLKSDWMLLKYLW